MKTKTAIKKPIKIKYLTFEDFVQHIKETTPEPHLHCEINGYPITHENDECYIITTLEGTHHFTPKDILIIGVKGEIYPCKIDIFEATYNIGHDQFKQPISDEEIEKWIAKEIPVNIDDEIDEEINRWCRRAVRNFGQWAIERMDKDDRELLLSYHEFYLKWRSTVIDSSPKYAIDEFLNSNK